MASVVAVEFAVETVVVGAAVVAVAAFAAVMVLITVVVVAAAVIVAVAVAVGAVEWFVGVAGLWGWPAG